MDCCNFPEYRPPYGWEYGYQPYGAVPAPYTPYAPAYYAQEYAASAQHDHYARYSYHYDYQHHQRPERAEHSLMDYNAYVSKERNGRRAVARRDVERARARTPAHHLPLPPTPPLDCGAMVNRGATYCEPQMSWSHYQQMGGGTVGLSGTWGGAWAGRATAHRDPLRHLAAMHDQCSMRNVKSQNLPMLNHPATPEPRACTPYSPYEESMYTQRAIESQRPHSHLAPEYVDYTSPMADRRVPTRPQQSHTPVRNAQERHEHIKEERRQSPPQSEKQAVITIPLPAFQQAFGSTEIGKFAEAFSRAEAAHDAELEGESIAANLAVELFPEWDASADPAWSQQQRPIKCEDTY